MYHWERLGNTRTLCSSLGLGRGWARCSLSVFKQLLLQELPLHTPAPDLTHSFVCPYTPSWAGPYLSLSLAASLGLPHYPSMSPSILTAATTAWHPSYSQHITWASFLQIYTCYSRHTFLQFCKLLILTVTCARNAAALTKRKQCWSAHLNLPNTPGPPQELGWQHSLVALCTFFFLFGD